MLKTELYLVLKKKWFDMILSGEKKEEYRDFTEYYIRKLAILDKDGLIADTNVFDTIKFQLGYRKDAPQIIVECKDVLIEFDEGVELGDDLTSDNCNFVIILGEILDKINL